MKILIKLIGLIAMFALIGCNKPIQLIDYYYIYPQDEFGDGYYLMCKLGSNPKIENLKQIKWNSKYIFAEQQVDNISNWFIIKAKAEELRCCNNDSLFGPLSTQEVEEYIHREKVDFLNEKLFK